MIWYVIFHGESGYRGNKPATVNRTLEVLKTMLKYKKLEWDYIKLATVPKGRIYTLGQLVSVWLQDVAKRY